MTQGVATIDKPVSDNFAILEERVRQISIAIIVENTREGKYVLLAAPRQFLLEFVHICLTLRAAEKRHKAVFISHILKLVKKICNLKEERMLNGLN